MSQQTNQLKQAIQHFHGEYTPMLRALASLLDDAGISHYSSGCGNKRITYDIFPASYYVNALIDLVSLERDLKTKSDTGLKDFCPEREYNPANQFVLYLQRWTDFSEQVMQREGDTQRGIASAEAKLLMNELMIKLGQRNDGKSIRLGAKMSSVTRPMDFFELMRGIGMALQASVRERTEHNTLSAKERMEQNYKKALAAANERIRRLRSFQAA
ncbi:MAG: hypothetical protein AB7L92_07055 [Alphaproteobacteria bacterium]